jgi:hypothetical protein
MFIMLGDEITVGREISGETTWVTGRVTGIVQNDHGELKYFYVRGIDSAFYMNDGWKFADEIEEGEDEDNG